MEKSQLKKCVSAVAQDMYSAFHWAGKYEEQIDGSGGMSEFINDSEDVRVVRDGNDNYSGCVICRNIYGVNVYINSIKRDIYAKDGNDVYHTSVKETVWEELDETLKDEYEW